MTKELSTKSLWTQEQINLITNTVAKGATEDELKLFLYTASRCKLDPLTKQIHFVKRGGQMTIQTGIDGYRAIAERSGTLAGIDDAIYDTESASHPGKATVTVYRMVEGIKVSYTASARWSEYAPQGNQAFMWNKMPYLMLGKCAEALALRKAFPNDLSGLYTNEEMAQADKTELVRPDYAEVKKTEEEFVAEVKDSGVGKVMEGEIVQDSSPQKKCPFCQKLHNGRYAKCIDCYWAEKNGTKIAAVKTKILINENEPPFI